MFTLPETILESGRPLKRRSASAPALTPGCKRTRTFLAFTRNAIRVTPLYAMKPLSNFAAPYLAVEILKGRAGSVEIDDTIGVRKPGCHGQQIERCVL